MSNFRLERDFKEQGFRCVIIGTKLGHRCGYIGIPTGHELYEVDYDSLQHIDIHGGWTWGRSGSDGYPIDSEEDLYWLGFDCGHAGDGKDFELIKELNEPDYAKTLIEIEEKYPTYGEVRTVEYLENEIRRAVSGIRENVKK